MASLKIRADNAQWLVRKAEQSGVAVSALLSDTNLDLNWVHQEDALISYPQYCRIISNLLDESGDPGIGLKLAKQINIAEFGLLGYAFMSCQTLNEALVIGNKFWELSGQLIRFSRAQDCQHLTVTHYPAAPCITGPVLVYAMEETFISSITAASSVINKPLDIDRVHFSYPPPEHQDLYFKEFNCPVHFNQGKNQIFIKSGVLDTPISTANPEVSALIKKQCETLLLRLKKSNEFVETVRRILVNSLGNFPSSREVAQTLGMSRSSFFRRLKEENTSFQTIRNEIRTEIAVNYLSETSLSIDQISDLIGFSEPTTFRSAFKKWTGQSASNFLKANRLQP